MVAAAHSYCVVFAVKVIKGNRGRRGGLDSGRLIFHKKQALPGENENYTL